MGPRYFNGELLSDFLKDRARGPRARSAGLGGASTRSPGQQRELSDRGRCATGLHRELSGLQRDF